MMYTYLFVDIGALLIPFIFSFHPALQFYKTWFAFFPAMLITALVFSTADVFFTRAGVWGFNPGYVTGIYLFSLPIEEYLFFVCIPYSCVFTYYSLKILLKRSLNERATKFVMAAISILLFIVGLLHYNRLYTSTTFIALSVFTLLNIVFNKSFLFSRFLMAYLILLIPFFICNGILTGTGIEKPVVWYNNLQNLGIRVLTIPVEDFFYGMLLILMNTVFYEWILQMKKDRQHAA